MNLEQARAQMVEQQVRAWTVLDARVLEVMRRVPREQFVPTAYRKLAFADTAIPLGHAQEMMAPKVEGRALQALDVQPGEEVLEIGTGSGFLSACLAALGGRVTSIEWFEDFTRSAQAVLGRLGIDGVRLEHGDGATVDEDSKYDVIAVTGSLPVPEPSHRNALRVGGRLFEIIGEAPVMDARLVTRASENEWLESSLFETVIPPLINARSPRPVLTL